MSSTLVCWNKVNKKDFLLRKEGSKISAYSYHIHTILRVLTYFKQFLNIFVDLSRTSKRFADFTLLLHLS